MRRFEILFYFCVLFINYCNWDDFSFLRLDRLSVLFHSAKKFKIVLLTYGVAAESVRMKRPIFSTFYDQISEEIFIACLPHFCKNYRIIL